MISIYKINKHFKIRHIIEGIRFEFEFKGKWISIKINIKELEFLKIIIKSMRE